LGKGVAGSSPAIAAVPELHSVDRMRAAHHIVKVARRRSDTPLELDA
jgi:hypothetical protein